MINGVVRPASRYPSPPRRWRYLPFVALLFLFSSVDAAFQESLWGARPASLAGAFTAIADDSNAPVYNPAGISWITQSELTFMYARLFSGVNLYSGEDTSRLGLSYFSYVPSIKEKKFGSYAVSWTNFVATKLYREDSLLLSWADSYQFEELNSKPVVSYGANLKLLRRHFSTDELTSAGADPVFKNGRDSVVYTADLGFMLRPNFSAVPGFKLGLAMQNVTQPDIGLTGRDRVPARYSFGVAYQDPSFPLLTPSLDIAHRKGRTLVSGAIESWVARNILALRLGGNEDQVAGGLGYQFQMLRFMTMRFDYAILWPFNVEGTNGSHRLSVTTNF